MTECAAVMPEFSGDEPICPKCGNAGATTYYMAYGDCIHDADSTVGSHPNERLHRRCCRCSYQWDEAVLP